MRRPWVVRIIGVVCLVLLGLWVERNTYWTETEMPMPLRGEARTNPFYVAEQFVNAVGATGMHDGAFTRPPTDAVVVLSNLRWGLIAGRRQALEQWVQGGGRLVVDESMLLDSDFQEWVGIDFETVHDDDSEYTPPLVKCTALAPTAPDGTAPYALCGFHDQSQLETDKPLLLALADEFGLQVARIAMGQGTVTAINKMPFAEKQLLDGDHAALFVRMAQLRRGDEVHFLSESDYPSMFALAWRYGSPALLLAALLTAAVLWRMRTVIGPPLPDAPRARRALTEQMVSTGEFTARGGGEALQVASMRAVEDAVRRRHPGMARLTRDQRRTVVQQATGLDDESFTDASHGGRALLASVVRRIEQARRQIVAQGSR